MEDENLLDKETLVQETQDVSPTAFTRTLVNRLGFSSQQHGTETVSIANGNKSKVGTISLVKFSSAPLVTSSCQYK